jgi:hypothetical protein
VNVAADFTSVVFSHHPIAPKAVNVAADFTSVVETPTKMSDVSERDRRLPGVAEFAMQVACLKASKPPDIPIFILNIG